MYVDAIIYIATLSNTESLQTIHSRPLFVAADRNQVGSLDIYEHLSLSLSLLHSLFLITDAKLSYFISHMTEADSHTELGKDGQVSVLG